MVKPFGRQGAKMRAQLVLLGLACLLPSPAPSALAAADEAVSAAVRPDFFNPTLHQKATIELSLKRPGPVSVSIVDGYGATVRVLPIIRATDGRVSVTWDGSSDGDGVVPDSAYSLSVRLAGEPIYQPFEAAGAPVERLSPGFPRADGLITYSLQKPSYVTLMVVQGSSRNGESSRVLKRIVDHELGTTGPIVERWHGFGDGGVYILDLIDARLELVAEPLPESVLITVGSRKRPITHDPSSRRPPKQASFANPIGEKAAT